MDRCHAEVNNTSVSPQSGERLRVRLSMLGSSEGGRTRPLVGPLDGWYRPHFVVEGDAELLGVTVAAKQHGLLIEFDAVATLVYEGVGYAKLVDGAEFSIVEGGRHRVGRGIVVGIDVDDM